jgi:hypothetical protein
MDVIKYIRKAYRALIKAQGYIVFDRFLPDNIGSGLYIILSDQEDRPIINKCGNSHETTIVINIIWRTQDNSSGVEADDVAEILIPLIENDGLVLDTGLTLVQGSSRKFNDVTDSGVDTVFKVYRRNIYFRHIVRVN